MKHRLLVMDDDPTGTQLVAEMPVVLDWQPASSLRDLRTRDCVYVLTNTRALDPADARLQVAQAIQAFSDPDVTDHVILRGDSTLRGHMLEEYFGLCDGYKRAKTPPYVLVPALPSAGRVTVNGIHFIERTGERVPLSQTEYAKDPVLGYRSSRLLDWAEERSSGFFPASSGAELSLRDLRSSGSGRVAEIIRELDRTSLPAVFAPDAETPADLEIIAQGLQKAISDGTSFVVRSAPALAAVMSGHSAKALIAPPRADGGLLVICGSHVPATTRQLAHVVATYPGVSVEADLRRLDSVSPEQEVRRLAQWATETMPARGIAIISTPRLVDHARASLTSSRRIALNLASVVDLVRPRVTTVLAKGGITSATIARHGLGGRRAVAEGPVAPGVACWSVQGTHGMTSLLVFPGNVGDDDSLRAIIDHVLQVSSADASSRAG